jgi:hypothetical protein
MKKARLLIIFVGCGTLTLGLSYAGEASKERREQALRDNRAASERPSAPLEGKKDQAAQKQDEPKPESHAAKKFGPAGPIKTEPRHLWGEPLHQPWLKKPGHAESLTSRAGKPLEKSSKQLADPRDSGPPVLARSRNATAALVGRVLVTSTTKYPAGPFGNSALQRKP